MLLGDRRQLKTLQIKEFCPFPQRKFKTTATFCGSVVLNAFRTQSNLVKIIFRSDESENRRGFKLNWKAISEDIGKRQTFYISVILTADEHESKLTHLRSNRIVVSKGFRSPKIKGNQT